MRRCVVLVVLTLAIASSADAQRVDPEFTRARQARIAALDSGDQKTFELYTADAFIVTGGTGQVENKAQRVARANRAQKQDPSSWTDHIITQYGDDTVIATWTQPGAGQGGSTRFLEVWVKERGTWKVAAVQITPVQARGDRQ